MLSPFAGTLASLYPDAQFILMIRDCFSWLDSRIERNIADAAYVNSALYAARYARRDDPFASEESPLRVAGLRPIASYLRAWADVNDGVLGNVPRDRLLVVRTEDLDASRAVLAEFAGVPQSSLRAVHANHRASRGGLLAEAPVSFVLARAEEHCRDLMEQFWGADWRQLTDRLPASWTTR
jgi:hypothetical protein